ncbi:HAMP domain-containing sensor histidine kinase [Modestobacter versicolor]|uniref:histidine kinase n=1 Tax=Modestobacter versicolor TaxID=429133 RepID=A0A839XSV0_9ACTN|nr:HAMP domain-containing sensor histidine kinase [Modestobacter versicolor]MBB3674700.1 two-component system OmpR family sensor kinase [Modestobacter versicolor]
MSAPPVRRRRPHRLSLRARLLVITLVLVLAALLGSTAALAVLLERSLVDQLDDRLQAAAALAAQPPVVLVAPGAPAPQVRNAVEGALTGDVHLVVLRPDGAVQRVVRPATGSPPALPPLDAAAVEARGERPFEAPARAGGHAWRVVATPAQGGTVVVAVSMAETDETLRDLGVLALSIDAVVVVLVAGAAWFAVRAGLRPLRLVETTAASIAHGDLAPRVPDLASGRTELGRLSAALNGMLDRIEAGDAARAATADRMRRFVADASHELRTPLFGIKGYTELYRMSGLPERADVDRAMGRIEGEAARLARLVEDLLLLARLDEDDASGGLPLRLSPMDLRTLAADALHDLHVLDPGRPVTLTGPGGGPPGSAPVLGDEARLRQVTSNLIGNAVAHTPPGARVRIGVGTHAGEAVLELGDDGPGMTAEQAARVFDRFYRADDGRGRAGGGGAGLGLAIVQSLVAAHHGRVEIDTALGAGAVFRVLLPLHAEAPQHAED